jgi:hypothetical protein
MKIKVSLILFLVVFVNIFAQFSYSPPPMNNLNNNMMFTPSFNQDQKYGCIAYMESGEKIEGDSYLYKNFEEFGMDYLKIDGQKITPADTDSVMVNSKIGYPHLEHWIFKVNSGKLNTYNIRPAVLNNKFNFLKKEGGLLEEYSKDLMRKHLSDDKSALDEFNRYFKQKTTSYLFYGAGAALFVGGFLSLPATEKDQPENNPRSFSETPAFTFMIAGGVSTLVGMIIKLNNKHSISKAVKIYNGKK